MRRKSDGKAVNEPCFALRLLCLFLFLTSADQVRGKENESITPNHRNVWPARAVNDSPAVLAEAADQRQVTAGKKEFTVTLSPDNKSEGSTNAEREINNIDEGNNGDDISSENTTKARHKARGGPFLVRAIGPAVVSGARTIFNSIAKTVMDGQAVIHDIEVKDEENLTDEQAAHESHPFVGVMLAVTAAILVGTSFIFQKRGLLITEARKVRKESMKQKETALGEFAYLLQWTWWCGMLSMALGEILNFVAYSIAPAILITPLGALRVIVSAVLSAIFLNERLNLHGKIGVLLSLVGSVMIIIHAPRHEKVTTFEGVLIHFTDSGFLLYCVILLAATIFLIVHVAPRRGRTDIMVYISICNIVGALCVLCGKGLGISLKELSTKGDAVYLHPLFWILVLGNVVGIALQIVYLNKALAIFNTSMITPIKYVFTNIFLVFGSILLFKEFDFMSGEDIVGISCGFITVVTGVVLLNLFKDKDTATSVTTRR